MIPKNTKEKDLELVERLKVQVTYGSANWFYVDGLMLDAARTIKRLTTELNKKKTNMKEVLL